MRSNNSSSAELQSSNWSYWSEVTVSIGKIGDSLSSSAKNINTTAITIGADKKNDNGRMSGVALRFGNDDIDFGYVNNSLGIDVSRAIETIYTPEQSLANVKKILSSIKDDRLYSAIAYYIIRDFAFYEHGLCKSLKNHFETYKVYKEFYLKTKNKELDPIYENENNLNFFYKNSSNARKRLLLAIQSKKRLLEKEQFLLKNLKIFTKNFI